jgi:hypothetical protein
LPSGPAGDHCSGLDVHGAGIGRASDPHRGGDEPAHEGPDEDALRDPEVGVDVEGRGRDAARRITTKLDVRDRAQAVIAAHQSGLVRVGDA